MRLADAGAALGFLPGVAAGCRRARRAQDADAARREHRRDPVRPHPVLGNVAEVDVAGRRLPRPDERGLVGEPGLVAHRAERADLPVGYRGGQPLVGAEQGGRRARRVTEHGERLLERVERLVRDRHRGPVVVRLELAELLVQAAAEPGARRRQAHVGLVLLRLVDAHRDREHLDVAVVVPLLHVPGDRRRPVDGLVVQREAVHQDVRQVHRADVRDVGQPGPAVDQRVVVVRLHVGAQPVEELAALEPVVEVVPVDRGHRGRVVAVLAAGGDEVQRPAVGEIPAQRDGVRQDLRVVTDPVR